MTVRIGYPYAASDPEKTRDAVVILYPNVYSGFHSICVNEKEHYLVESDPGPKILSGLSNKGVKGVLLEAQDQRNSIARGDRIIGQGTSMQLALVLAVFAKYPKDIEKVPLLLFSAAIEHPIGAPPFLDAQIKPYCSEEVVCQSLVKKYRAAQMAKAKALVLTIRDATILSKELQQPWEKLQTLKNNQNRETSIIGVEEHSLPEIAKLLKISSYHYKRRHVISTIFIWATTITLMFALLLFLYKNFNVENTVKSQNTFKKQKTPTNFNNIPVLIKGLQKNNLNAAEALTKLGSKALVPVISVLDEENPELFLKVIKLIDTKEAWILSALLEKLTKKPLLLIELAQKRKDKVIVPIIQAIASPKLSLSLASIKLLETVAIFCKIIFRKKQCPAVKYVINALGNLGAKAHPAQSMLLKMSKSNSTAIKKAAISTLSKICTNPQILKAIYKIMHSLEKGEDKELFLLKEQIISKLIIVNSMAIIENKNMQDFFVVKSRPIFLQKNIPLLNNKHLALLFALLKRKRDSKTLKAIEKAILNMGELAFMPLLKQVERQGLYQFFLLCILTKISPSNPLLTTLFTKLAKESKDWQVRAYAWKNLYSKK